MTLCYFLQAYPSGAQVLSQGQAGMVTQLTSLHDELLPALAKAATAAQQQPLAQQVHHTSSRTCLLSHPLRACVHHTLQDFAYLTPLQDVLHSPRKLFVWSCSRSWRCLQLEEPDLQDLSYPSCRMLWEGRAVCRAVCACCCKHHYGIDHENFNSIWLAVTCRCFCWLAQPPNCRTGIPLGATPIGSFGKCILPHPCLCFRLRLSLV